MNNYEYIIASLPVLSQDGKDLRNLDYDGTVAFIRQQCSPADRMLTDQLLRGFDEETLGEAFYREALGERIRKADPFSAEPTPPQPPRNAFIRDYFTFDLRVRNAKVRFLNKALGRPAGQDIFLEPDGEFPEAERLAAVLAEKDILKRERGLDDLMWEKALSLVTFRPFSIDAVLGFIARFHILERWIRLDEQTGRELFRRLVEEVRGTFRGVDFHE